MKIAIFAACLALGGCMSTYQVKTVFVNSTKEKQTVTIETDQTIKGRPAVVFAFYTKTIKFLQDELVKK